MADGSQDLQNNERPEIIQAILYLQPADPLQRSKMMCHNRHILRERMSGNQHILIGIPLFARYAMSDSNSLTAAGHPYAVCSHDTTLQTRWIMIRIASGQKTIFTNRISCLYSDSLGQRFRVRRINQRRLPGDSARLHKTRQLAVHGHHIPVASAVDHVVNLMRPPVPDHVLDGRVHRHHFKHGFPSAVHRRHQALGHHGLQDHRPV